MVEQISPRTLYDWLDARKFALVDTRPAESYDAWHVPGAANFPFGPDESFDEERLATFRRLADGTRPVVTVCAKGVTSLRLAEQLEATGDYDDVYAVDDGMRGWSQVYEAVPVEAADGLELLQVQRVAKGCLGYVVGCRETGTAAVVDATRHVSEFEDAADAAGLEIAHVLDTHVHADHVSGGRQLAERLDVPYYLGARAEERDVAYDYEPLARNEVLDVGNVALKALYTPGHTTEAVSYLVDGDAVLTGDTVFVDSTGRTELEFGAEGARTGARLQYDSIHGTLLSEPDSVTVLPGHATVLDSGEWKHATPGDPVSTTIGRLRTSLDVLELDEEAFVDYVRSHLPEKPPNYEAILAVNRGVLDLGSDAEATELELGPNRCSAS
ncbi:MBL fold metallo-hydrolase [Salinirarus marinus]|uniref:MBL fold metallo-hydrolase n=1 Tax=Salinirarus marinus TaxID=3068310 RepID=UPI003C6CBC1A